MFLHALIPNICIWSEEQKQKYRGMFETQKSRNKTSSGDIGLNIRTLASPKWTQSYDKRPYTHRIFFKSQFLCSVSIYSISCGRNCCSHQKFDLDLGPTFEKKNLTLAMTFEPKEIFRLQKLGYKSWFTDNSNSLCGKYFLIIPCHDLDLWLTSL